MRHESKLNEPLYEKQKMYGGFVLKTGSAAKMCFFYSLFVGSFGVCCCCCCFTKTKKYQQGSPRQDPAGNRTTRRPPDDRKATHTAVLRTCLPFNRSGQNHFARHSERGKKTRQTEEGVGKQYQGTDRPGVCQVPEGSGEQRNVEETGCEIICGAQTTLAVKG